MLVARVPPEHRSTAPGPCGSWSPPADGSEALPGSEESSAQQNAVVPKSGNKGVMGTAVSGQLLPGLGVLVVGEPCGVCERCGERQWRQQHSGSMWKEKGEGGKAVRQKNSLYAGIPRGFRDALVRTGAWCAVLFDRPLLKLLAVYLKIQVAN